MVLRKTPVNRLQVIVFTIVVLAGVALFAGFAHYNALHEQFLNANFDSVHGARTLLKARSFLHQAEEKLESSRIPGSDSRSLRAQAVQFLALAASYGAEGTEDTHHVRAELTGRIQLLAAKLKQLAAPGPEAATDEEIRSLVFEVRDLAEAFGVAELERWGTLSSLNAELDSRMEELRLFIGAMVVIFLVIMGTLARSLIRTRQAEAELTEAKVETEAIQQTTLDASPLGIIYVDARDLAARRIVAANRQMTEIFGYRPEELLGLPLEGLHADPDSYRRMTAGFGALLASGGVFREETLMRRRDGSLFWCAVSGKAIDTDDSAGGVVCMLEDISELKRTTEELESARRQAEAANQAKSEFLANMSHELRTPFTGVLGMLDLLSHTGLDARQRQYVELAHRSTKQLLGIVDDILDLSKIEAGKLPIEPAAVDLRALLADIAQFHALAASEKALAFGLEMDGAVPASVLTDPVRLRQIIDNLVGNAIKFTAAGKVELQVECLAPGDSGSRVRFCIIDTGIGIAPDKMERIFDKFTQADSSTVRIYGGSGLGLAICKKLVAALGGVIGVDSVEGQGSRFWFELDLSHGAGRAGSMAVESAAQAVRLPAPTRILLADDNEISRRVIGEFLHLLGASVFEAGNGEAAVALAGEVRPDIILMDCQMPGCDGYEATRRIRAREAAGKRVPIIALTAHAMSTDRDKCLAAGMDDYLTKPISSELLARRIAMHLQPVPAQGEAVLGHVLLAEDDPAIQCACRELLQRLGCRVTVAGNGQEALDFGENADFDLVLLDCRMPVLDGWETARRWRARECARQQAPTAIIAMTAGHYYGEQDDCRAAGMNDVLFKPFSEESVRFLLEEWLAPRYAEESAVG